MTAQWLFRALAVALLLGLAALAAERVAGWFGRPRRWVWGASMAATLLLPLLALAAPGLLPAFGVLPEPGAAVAGSRDAERIALEPAGEAPRAVAAVDPSSPDPLSRALALGWLAASLGMLGVLAWTHRRLAAVPGRCALARLDGTPVLVAERAGPAVVGVFAPEIVVPRWVMEAPEEDRRLIVRHEREHVAGGDARLLALASLAVAAMPWNPALWWQHRRLRLAVETDCDARVLAAGASPRAYGLALLRTAGAPPFLSLLTLAWGERSTDLERRILAMSARRPTHRILRSLPLAAAALAAALVACDAADPSGQPQAAAPALPRTTEGVWNGRATSTTDLPDGTSRVTVGPDMSQPQGTLGMSWSYKPDRPIRVYPGDEPKPLNVYPEVSGVSPGSPAARAGLLTGDTIVSVNGRDGRLGRIFPNTIPGTEYAIRVRRDGTEREVRLIVGPDTRPAAGAR
jgi:hypothetical protein